MISTRLAYRNIPKRKARTILTCTAVILGVALLIGINMATASAMQEFTGYINRFWGSTDIVVRHASSIPFEEGNLSIIQSNLDITTTASRLEVAGNASGTPVQLVGLDAENDFDFASFNVTGARTLHSGQALITDSLAAKLDLTIGSNLTIITSNIAGQPITLNVVVAGLDHPFRTIGPTIFLGIGEMQSSLSMEGMVTHIYAEIRNPSNAVTVRNQLQSQLGQSFDVVAPKAEAINRIDGQLAGFQLGLNIMALVALVVCSFIVFNTLFMTVTERTYEIGVLRAIGTSRQQVFRIFLTEGMLLGTIGAVAGVLAGVGLSKFFVAVFEDLGFPQLPDAVLTPWLALTGLAAGLAAVLAGSFYPALRASRIEIIHAIRPMTQGLGRTRGYWIASLVGLSMLTTGVVQAFRLAPVHIPYLDIVLIPLSLVILGAVIYRRQTILARVLLSPISKAVVAVVSKSGRRRLVRSTVSFGMITITLSFVIMIGGIQGGVETSLEQGIREALGADIILVANQPVSVDFASSLMSQSAVSDATPLSPSPVPAKAVGPTLDSRIGVLGVDPSEFPKIVDYTFVGSTGSNDAYRQLGSSNETALLPDSLASKLGAGDGDMLTIYTPTMGPVSFLVAGIFTGPVLQYIQFGESYASDSIIVSLNSQHLYFKGNYDSQIFLVNLKPEYKHMTRLIAQDLATQYPNYGLTENSITLDQLLGLVRTTINKVFAVILLILYFALLIATIGISANMIMNVSERKREIGLLRSQGMSRRQILWMFIGEGVILGLFGFLLSIPSGLLLLQGATNSTTIAGFWLPYVIPWNAMGQSFLLALTSVLLGTFYAAFKASKLEITTALRNA